MKKQIILILILSCLCSNLSSQIITDYYSAGNNSGQHQFTEKVYLHVDRSAYNPGDEIWFKAYVIDPATNKLSVNTNNLHVELLSAEGKILQGRIVRIEDGMGTGDFHLIDSMPGGIYKIRAYTNHMRNFGNDAFFTKKLTIVGPDYDEQIEAGTLKNPTGKLDVSFFPEGGSLIDDITSTVAFRIEDQSGKGADATFEIYSSDGNPVIKVSSSHLGMGFFNYKPSHGFSHYAIVRNKNGEETKSDLPESFSTGVTIRTNIISDRELILTVNTNEETLPTLKGKNLTVTLSSHNLINQIIKVKIDTLVNNFLIPLESFSDGVLRVTLAANNLPLCERLVFFQRSPEVKLNVTTDKKEYSPREKISVLISASGDSQFSGYCALSFSAAEGDFTDDPSLFPRSIASWFLLESDVHGEVEEPSYYFDPSNKNRLADLDILLLTQGWRDFRWKYDSIPSFNHEIGFSISGSVKRIVGKKTVEGAMINMGLFSNYGTQYLTTETNSEGAFTFKEIDITGPARVFISSTGKNNNIVGEISVDSIKYDPPEVEKFIASTFENLSEPVNFTVLKQEATVKMNIKKKYTLNDTIDIGEVIITAQRVETVQEKQVKESRKVYGTPGKEWVVPEEMENFAGDVFDMISGRLAGISVRRSFDTVRVFLNSSVLHGPALILLDGMRIESDNLDLIRTIPPYMIDRVDVLNPTPAYGMSGANGVINIITKTEMRRVPSKPTVNTASFEIKGFDAPRIFYSPKHNTPKNPSYTPDTRTTIFWEPNIMIEKNSKASLEFYNADNPASINITVEGITEEGIPVTGRTTYQVR